MGAGIIAIICFGWQGWQVADRQGWIVHSRVVEVRYSDTWSVGESRDCRSDLRTDFLNCFDFHLPEPLQLQPRAFSVKFRGKVEPVLTDSLRWDCKREADSLSCMAVPWTSPPV